MKKIFCCILRECVHVNSLQFLQSIAHVLDDSVMYFYYKQNFNHFESPIMKLTSGSKLTMSFFKNNFFLVQYGNVYTTVSLAIIGET